MDSKLTKFFHSLIIPHKLFSEIQILREKNFAENYNLTLIQNVNKKSYFSYFGANSFLRLLKVRPKEIITFYTIEYSSSKLFLYYISVRTGCFLLWIIYFMRIFFIRYIGIYNSVKRKTMRNKWYKCIDIFLEYFHGPYFKYGSK